MSQTEAVIAMKSANFERSCHYIVRVADVFSSLSEQRAYKPALAAAQALEMMETMAGSKLDAESFRVLKQIIAEQGLRSDVPAPADRHQC